MEKATFRLPESLLEELRERARSEGRSLNATAADILRQGLGRPVPIHDEIGDALGSMVVRSATVAFDRRAFDERARLIGPIRGDSDEDLDWARGDR
jgi:plasmid stability protein